MAFRYIAENLSTPKTSIAERGSLERELLLNSRQLKTITTMYEQSEGLFDDAIAAARDISALVYASLDFAPTTSQTPELSAESLANREATNCFGHTITVSECLEQAGVEHFICYANQHTFVMLLDRKTARAFMVDPTSREFTCEITGAIGGEDPLDQLAVGELRAVNTLYTAELMAKLPPSINREKFIMERPWLTFTDQMSPVSIEPKPTDNQLQLITLPSVPGRELLIDQYNAMIHASKGDMGDAAQLMEDLAGVYLDIDPRNNLKPAEALVRGLIRGKNYDAAIRVAQAINESLLPGDKSKNRLFLPDTMRTVAKKMGDAALILEAIKIIDSLPKNSLTQGKLQAASREYTKML